MTIGDRIKNRRIELDLTVDDLADEIDKSRATIYRYENGDIENLPTTVLEPLAEVLYTTPAYLMGWTDNPEDWERIANDQGIAPPNDFEGDPEDWYKMKRATEDDYSFEQENIARDNTERRLLMLCRKAGDVPKEEKDAIINQFEATIDIYLKAKGIKGD